MAAAEREGKAHREAQMDRNAFHRALVTALADPYTISGRATAEKLRALERVKGGRQDSFVLDARYELGKRDDAYLQAPVLPLQTSDDDKEPLGLRLDPLFENAHRSGLYKALLEELHGKVDPDVQRLDAAVRLAGFLMTMPEVYKYAAPGVAIKALERFERITTAQEGQVAIDALVAEARAAFAPANEGEDRDVKKKAKKELDTLLMKMGVLVSGEYQNLDNPATLVIEANLCAEHGIHQLDEEIQKWLNAPVSKELLDQFKKGKPEWFPSTSDSYLLFKDTPTHGNLKAFLEDWKDYLKPSGDDKGWYDDTWTEARKELVKEPKPRNFAYTAPKAVLVDFGKGACGDRPGVQARVDAQPPPKDKEGVAARKKVVKTDEYAKWTPGLWDVAAYNDDPGAGATFTESSDGVSKAVSRAALLEAVVEASKFQGENWLRLAARCKVEQLRDLQTCIEAAKAKKFAGDSFKLPVLRCRAIEDKEKGELDYYKFKVSDGKLTPKKLDDTDGAAKDFEQQIGLRDLSNINLPTSVDITKLRAIVYEGLDALEELRCNDEEQKKMRDHLKELDEERKRLQDPDDPDDLVDTTARKRRRDVWSDGLREAALANDKLYAFARQLGGAIGEPISEVAIIDDSKLAAESKQLRDVRRRASQRAAEQHADLVKNVISQVIKDSQLQLGITDQGSSFAGTSTGAIDLGKLKVVSGNLRREASDLAGLGKGGDDADRFFGNSVRLESLLRSGTGEMTFSDLLAQLRAAGQELQQASMGEMDLEGMASSTSIEYLSNPRNSLMLRWRPEALAAVRESFAVLKQEMRYQHSGMAVHTLRAYELIEGRDIELSTLFATLCGLKLAANRLHSGSSSMYTSQWAAKSNNTQLRIALSRVVRRSCSYAMNGNAMGSSRLNYFR